MVLRGTGIDQRNGLGSDQLWISGNGIDKVVRTYTVVRRWYEILADKGIIPLVPPISPTPIRLTG